LIDPREPCWGTVTYVLVLVVDVQRLDGAHGPWVLGSILRCVVLYRAAVMLLRRCGVEPGQLEVRVKRTTLHETMVALTPGPIRKAWTYDIALEVPPTE